MSETNLFEVASRERLRFESTRGNLSIEDLWTLPLTSSTGRANLDDIARQLYRQIKESGDGVSFVNPVGEIDSITTVKLDLVKYIISIKLAERDAAVLSTTRKAQKQRLLELISQKENEALSSKSVDELRAMVEQL